MSASKDNHKPHFLTSIPCKYFFKNRARKSIIHRNGSFPNAVHFPLGRQTIFRQNILKGRLCIILRHLPNICHTVTALTNDTLARKCFLFYSNHVLKKKKKEVLSNLQFRFFCSRIIRVVLASWLPAILISFSNPLERIMFDKVQDNSFYF